MMPKVSVVIPTYNYGHFISQAIDSVLAQSYKDYEVLVVDDGSIDNTREVVESFGSAIRYIYQQNQRMSAARNTGIRSAHGEYIAFLDSDDAWLPEKLEKQMKLFEIYPKAGLISCGSVFLDVHGNTITSNSKKEFNNRDVLFRSLLLKNVVSGGSNAVVKKECFDVLGLFDENLKATAEDWDMWWRIFSKYDVRFSEECLVKVLVKGDSVSASINIDKMLPDELRMLDKLFSKTQIPFTGSDRLMAYSQRYFSAALAYMQNGNRSKALIHIVKSMLFQPFYFARRKECWVLLLRISVGDMIYRRCITLMKKGISHVF